MSLEKSKLEALYKALLSIKNPLPKDLESFKDHMTFRTLRRKEHFLKAGDVAEEIAFISLGLLRMYYLTEKGQEFNRSFASENTFCSAHASLVTKTPSRFFIQALEPSELIVFRQDKIYENPFWREVQLLSIERMFLVKEKREAQFLLDSPEVRYQTFLKDHPGLASRLPDHHIASYLGISAVHLSRIKKK